MDQAAIGLSRSKVSGMMSNLRARGLPDVCFSYIVRQFLVPAAGGLHNMIPRACLVVTKNYDVLDFARFSLHL